MGYARENLILNECLKPVKLNGLVTMMVLNQAG
jgi:hypothetical protein